MKNVSLKKQYIQYLMFLYELETDEGMEIGEYPTYEEFLVIRQQEQMSSLEVH
tara:strand:+ start:573 stop:731 length:159 start_codon:yes stop_codon:yes gene_type:complete